MFYPYLTSSVHCSEAVQGGSGPVAKMTSGDVKTKLEHLNQAKNLALNDPNFYPDILKGILPVIVASDGAIELRRWGSDFLAETFSSPQITSQTKQELALTCLEHLLTLLNELETGILKNVIQCSSSIYPLIFRYICHNKSETAVWQQMVAVKAKILSMLDRGAEGVRLGCIKFVQRIILVQTPGASDPRVSQTPPSRSPAVKWDPVGSCSMYVKGSSAYSWTESLSFRSRILYLLNKPHQEPNNPRRRSF